MQRKQAMSSLLRLCIIQNLEALVEDMGDKARLMHIIPDNFGLVKYKYTLLQSLRWLI